MPSTWYFVQQVLYASGRVAINVPPQRSDSILIAHPPCFVFISFFLYGTHRGTWYAHVSYTRFAGVSYDYFELSERCIYEYEHCMNTV